MDRRHDDSALATMHPAYFAMVMATGIVSIACLLTGLGLLARILFWLNIPFYIALWALTIVRCVRFPDRVLADLLNHSRSVGFFTIVAATCVLGTQALLIGGSWPAAAALWAWGIVLLMLSTYGIISILTMKETKPGLAEGINGGWLLPVVAGQSVAVLGAQLAGGFALERQPSVLLFCLVIWLGAGMLYVWIISLIFYRYTFFAIHPSDLAPPYWINMGAVAISTLAGTMLLAAAPRSRLLDRLGPFHRRRHAALLVDRDLVGPDAGDPWRVAASLSPVPVALRSAVLGRGLPTRNVHRVHISRYAGDAGEITRMDPTRLCLYCAGGMDRHARRPGPPITLPARVGIVIIA